MKKKIHDFLQEWTHLAITPQELKDVQLCFSETEMKFLKVLLQKITAFYEFRLTDWLFLKLERL